MASETESDAGYRRVTPVTWVLAPYSMGTWMRQWFRVWRWPAGVVAGLVLWLALVAVVGAATSVGSAASGASDCPWACRFDPQDYNAFVINIPPPDLVTNADVMTTIVSTPLYKGGIDCRPGSSPRP